MDAFWQELRQRADLYAGHILGAVVILAIGYLTLRYLVGPLRRVMDHSRIEPATASFLANSVRSLVIIVVVIGALQQLGVETASLLTVLAAGGLAVALSLQNMLANFTAGMLLLSFRMLRVGDLIETGTMRGRVTDIFPFHVVLVTEDNQVLTVPNSLLTANGFRNHSGKALRQARWSLPLRPVDDLAAAKKATIERLLADPRVLREPPPRAFVQEWAEDKRMLAVQAWVAVADHSAVQEELLEGLGLALEELRQREDGADKLNLSRWPAPGPPA